MTESDTSILFDQYHSHLYLLSHLSAFLDQKRSQEMQESKWSYSLDFGLKLLKRRKETLGKRFSGSCSERMVRAPPFERGKKTGGQRLNHEDCKVAGLQRSRPGEATRTIDQRRNDPWVGYFSICSLTAKFDIQSFDESRWWKAARPD